MLERALIALVLAAAGAGAFVLLRSHQMRRASRAALAAGKPAILYFRSDGCAPCATQARFLQQVGAQFGERIVIEEVDAEVDQAAAQRYAVFTVPTVLIADPSGTVRFANYGLTDAGKLAGQLRSVDASLPS